MLAFHLPTTVDKEPKVLVSFYRGAVVFHTSTNYQAQKQLVLVPFYRGAVVFLTESEIKAIDERFSSPFIEERLYLENFKNVFVVSFSALLSWSNIDQNNGLD